MASFNKIIIVGYLGRDPELRYTPQGDAVCSFTVATTEKTKAEEHTTWFRVTVWRRQAENVHQYLSKGKQVYVEGRLRQASYEDREGNNRTTLEVTASDIQFLSPKGSDDYEAEPQRDTRERSQAASALGSQGQPKRSRGAASQQSLGGMEDAGKTVITDDDIPF